MSVDKPEIEAPFPQAENRSPDKSTLELCFIAIMAVFVFSALVAALTYSYVSAIAPLCIVVPLLILVGVQFKRALKASRAEVVVSDLSQVIKGQNRVFNAITTFIGWMTVLLALIFFAGHYVGIAVFMFILLRLISKERMLLSALVSAGVTIFIYVLFEFGFNIEMYRGLVYKLLANYGVF